MKRGPTLAFGLLASIVLNGLVAAESAAPSLRKITFPGRPWALVLDLPGFEFSDRSTRADGKGISAFGSSDSTGVIISIYLEHAARAGDARACRDFYQAQATRGGPRRRDVRFSEREDMALVEFYGPRVGEPALDNQRHLNAYLSHDGIWIDIHLSKPDFKPSDRALFDAILGSVKFGAAPPDSGPGLASGGRGPEGSAAQVFTAPGGQWSVRVVLPGFTQQGSSPAYEYQGSDPTRSAYRLTGMEWHGASVETGVGLIVGITEARQERNAADCRAGAWSSFKADRAVRLKDPRLSDRGTSAVLEYLVTQMDGHPVNGKYVHAFRFRDGDCVVVSLFKTDYRPEDQQTFEAVLDSIEIRDADSGDAPPMSPPEPAPPSDPPGPR